MVAGWYCAMFKKLFIIFLILVVFLDAPDMPLPSRNLCEDRQGTPVMYCLPVPSLVVLCCASRARVNNGHVLCGYSRDPPLVSRSIQEVPPTPMEARTWTVEMS